jgi:hypothetical protein
LKGQTYGTHTRTQTHKQTNKQAHIHKPVYEKEDVTVSWNQAVHTDREFTANRPDIIIKNKKRGNMHTDRCGNTCRQKCRAKGSGKALKYIFMNRNTTNVEHKICDYSST